MRLGGQMQHGIGAIVTKYPADVGGVADINALEMILGVTGDARDRVDSEGDPGWRRRTVSAGSDAAQAPTAAPNR